MADEFLHGLTDSWNSAITTFDAFRLNVTDAASDAESRLMRLQIGSADKFDVRKDGQVTLTNNDAGASLGPTLNLFRDSSSPAASDHLGELLFRGRDDAANVKEYAHIYAVIDDPASGSEEASLILRTIVGGAPTTIATLNTSGLSLNSPLAVAQGGTGGNSPTAARDGIGLGDIATQDAANVLLTGGAINGAIIGGTTPAAATFTALAATGVLTLGTTVIDCTTEDGVCVIKIDTANLHDASKIDLEIDGNKRFRFDEDGNFYMSGNWYTNQTIT